MKVQVHMDKSHIRVNLGVNNELVVRPLLENTIIDRIIKLIHPIEREVASRYSPLVPMLMEQKTHHAPKKNSENNKSDICND